MEPVVYIKYYEFLLLPFYLFLFFWVANWIIKKYYADSNLKKFLYLGLAAKMFGSIAFALMSQYFFKEGDTFMYFSGGLDFKRFLFHNFPENADLLFLPAEDYGNFYKLNAENINNFGYMSSLGNLFTAKISGLFSLFSFDGYLLTSLFFGLFAFSGMWQLFNVFSRIYPTLIKQCSWCFIFLPSILYWGGGVMKDSVCLGSIGWLFSSFYLFFVLKKKKWVHIVIIFISAYTLFSVKSYIAFSICSVLGIWLFINSFTSISNDLIRRLASVATVLLVIALLFVFSEEIISQINNEAVSLISDTVKGVSKNYEMANVDAGSSLTNIGDVQPNLSSIISKVPIAINNALFRPYIWEARKLNILMSALENMTIMLFTLFIFFKRGFFKTLVKIFTNQLIFFCFIFSILFAILIGLTCFNYGSLVRYKLPIMPFYCFMLILLYYTDKKGNVIIKDPLPASVPVSP
jgi:hypothetical protein